jgi:hypothetical protein
MAEWAARQNSPAIIDSIGIAETRDLATRRFDQVAGEYFPLWQKAVNARLISQTAAAGQGKPEHDWVKNDAWLAAIKSQVTDEVRPVWNDRGDWYKRVCAAEVNAALERTVGAWRRKLRDEELLLIQSWEQLKQSQQFGDVIKKAAETLAKSRELSMRSQSQPPPHNPIDDALRVSGEMLAELRHQQQVRFERIEKQSADLHQIEVEALRCRLAPESAEGVAAPTPAQTVAPEISSPVAEPVADPATSGTEPGTPAESTSAAPVTSEPPAPANPNRRKPGPKSNLELAAWVTAVVKRIASDGDWKSRLDEILEAMDGVGKDEAPVCPVPPNWRRHHKWKRWSDCDDRRLAIKAIEYRLKLGENSGGR